MWERGRGTGKTPERGKSMTRTTEQLLHEKELTKLGLMKLVKQRDRMESPIKAYKS